MTNIGTLYIYARHTV